MCFHLQQLQIVVQAVSPAKAILSSNQLSRSSFAPVPAKASQSSTKSQMSKLGKQKELNAIGKISYVTWLFYIIPMDGNKKCSKNTK